MDSLIGVERFPDAETPEWVDPNDLAARHLEGDEWLVIRPMMFSLRLAVMTEDNASVEHWCFSSFRDALVAWLAYPDVPRGWSRHQRRDLRMERPDEQ